MKYEKIVEYTKLLVYTTINKYNKNELGIEKMSKFIK